MMVLKGERMAKYNGAGWIVRNARGNLEFVGEFKLVSDDGAAVLYYGKDGVVRPTYKSVRETGSVQAVQAHFSKPVANMVEA